MFWNVSEGRMVTMDTRDVRPVRPKERERSCMIWDELPEI